MKTIKTIAVILTLCVIVFLTCRNRNPRIIKVDPVYAQWVSGFTGGTIQKNGSIRIELAKDYAPKGSKVVYGDTTLPDSNILKEIIQLDPEVSGTARWLNSRVIEFTPSKPLESSTLYTVSFSLSRVVKVPSRYKKMEFQFRTIQQNLYVDPEGLKNYNQTHPSIQYLTGTFNTSDGFDTSLIPLVIHAEQDGRPLKMRFDRASDEGDWRFYFDSVIRKKEASELKLTWNGNRIKAEEKGEMKYEILALGEFSLENAKVLDNGDQKVELHFTDPIFPDQSFENFVEIEGFQEKLTFSCNLNVLTVFLPNRIIGNKKVTIKKGLKNFAREGMLKTQETDIEFERPLPAIHMPGAGNILPNSQGLRIPLETINLAAVDVRVIKIFENNVQQFLQVNDLDGNDGMSRVGKVVFESKIDLGIKDSVSLLKWQKNVLDLSKLIKTDVGSIYRIGIRFRASYTGCDCEGEHQAGYNWNEDLETEDDGFRHEQDLDYDSRYYSYDNYDDQNAYGDPCSNDYYYGKAINRNILASDLGVIYKGDIQKTGYAFVSNLITAKPEPGTTVELYDYAKQRLASAITDENGMARFNLPTRPFLLIAKKAAQRGYLKLSSNLSKSMSRFDTDGESVKNGLKGFIYGERGVWRPGDSIFLTFMLEHGKSALPPNHPYVFEFSDPNGQVIETRNLQLQKGDLDVIKFRTSNSAATGNYNAKITLGNLVVQRSIDIETVKPNRLKILTHFEESGLNSQGFTKSNLEVKWLHGASAPRLQTQVELSLYPRKNPFEKFKSFVFESPTRKDYRYKMQVFNGHLDENGNAEINVSLENLKSASGVLDAAYISRVYENSGNMNMDKSETVVYPFKNYLGLRIPEEGTRGSLTSGAKQKFEIVNIDASQNMQGAKDVKVYIYKIDWKWWYEQDEEYGETDYLSRPATYLYFDTTLNLPAGKGSLLFGVSKYEWGRFLMVVKDEKGGHECGTIFTYDYPYWGRQNQIDNDGATMLALSTNKSKYEIGEKTQVTFPSVAGSRALVSIETSRKVVRSFWVNTTEKETRCSFDVSAEMVPNAFVHITVVQPHLQTANNLPIRLYGVVPIEVYNKQTKLNPVISSADEFRPQQNTNIVISEAMGRAMYYTLAIVDEGLLDLTHFKTPDAHKRFYAKEALGVRTWDIYDAVIGANSGKMDRLLSIGGDGSYDEENGSKAQRFKPMVKFLGPYYLNAGGKVNHKIMIPNYMGSVKIMLVAKHNEAYGNASKEVAVKQPLMVLSTFPRVLGPDELVRIPVTVFAMKEGIQNVKVKFQLKGEAKLVGNSERDIHFKKPGEEIIYYEIKTNQAIGILKANIVVSSGNYQSSEDVEIEIRTPNPLESRNTDIALEPGQSIQVPVNWFGIRGSNSLTLQFSSLPIYGIQNRLDYLIQYPHGCIEQTTSSVFAQLYLDKIMNLTKEQSKEIQTNISAALQRYHAFQTDEGGFAYWPGEDYSSEWGSNYAGNFILEAEKTGYVLSKSMRDRWIKYQQKMAKNWRRANHGYMHSHGDESDCLTQAYRLYLLALAGKPDLGAMNLMLEEKNIGTTSSWRLASAFALCGRTDVSNKITTGLSWNIKPYRELSYSYGSGLRDQAIILECLGNMSKQSISQPLFNIVSNQLNSPYNMNTQEAAYCLMAICTWANAYTGELNISITSGAGITDIMNGKKSMNFLRYAENKLKSNDKLTIKNNGKHTVHLREIWRGSPLNFLEKTENQGMQMKWTFADENGKYLSPDKIAAGTDFTAKVVLENTSDVIYREMVLKEIIPSGWEITDSRLFGGIESPARYANIRDDRAYYYFDLAPKTSREFIMHLHASFEGEFYLPAPYAEAMYDESIHCSGKGMRIKVTKPTGML